MPKYLYVLVAALFIPLSAQAQQNFGTGLMPITPKELKELNKYKIKKVRPNKLAIERVNAEAHRPILDPKDAADENSETEILGATSTTSSTSTSTSEPLMGTVPGMVDNQALPSFPAIGNQAQESSCVAWATAYYQMSHETCLARGCNNISLKQAVFSPRWTYNMINYGSDGGSNFSAAYQLHTYNGAAMLSDLPYVAGNYRFWDPNSAHWLKAINYRMKPLQTIGSINTDTGMANLKQLLANGHVLVFGTYINSLVFTTVKANPALTNQPFAGQPAVQYMNGVNGGHAMTIVGYDDTVWVDINANGVVDAGENGALKIVNSWGTACGVKCGNGRGYFWIPYDAFKTTSAVAGGPSSGRVAVAQSNAAYFQAASASYTPKLVGMFTLNSLTRSQLKATVGTSASTTNTGATSSALSGAIQFQGGAYAFNGTTTAVTSTFALDLSDVIPSGTTNLNYYVTLQDSASGNAATLSHFDLYDPARGVVASNMGSLSVDGNTNRLSINYSFNDGNLSPVAKYTSTQTATTTSVSVSFNASTSYDPDGTIASYSWNFGDGTIGTGAATSHVYSKPGTFTAILTITDNKGASAQYSAVYQGPADTVAPTSPSPLTGTLSRKGKTHAVTLSWHASTDNSGAVTYRIYRNNLVIGTSTTTSYRDTGVVVGASVYKVEAVDSSKNVSVSNNVSF